METSSQIYVNPLSDAGFKALLCDPANKRDLIALIRHDRDTRGDALEQGVACGPALHGRGR